MSGSAIRAATLSAAKVLAQTGLIFAVLNLGGFLGGVVFFWGADFSSQVDPAEFAHASLMVNSLHAAALAILAKRLAGTCLRKAAVLFALIFGVQGVLTVMETVYFISNGNLNLTLDAVIRGLGSTGVAALLGAVAAACLFHEHDEAARLPRPKPDRLAIRLTAAILLYPIIYWTAGIYVALPRAEVTDFYADGIDNINPATLLALQIIRGSIWAALAYTAARYLAGSRLIKALHVGFAFSVFMTAQLIYPNDAMPASVRLVHAVELIISNFLYGILAVFIVAGVARADERKSNQ